MLESARRPLATAAAIGAIGLVAPSASPAPRFDRRCTPAIQVQLVRSVVAAFNAGNGTRLDGLIARERAFRWFSDAADDRLGRAAEDRSTLRTYLRRRHRRHDRITLVGFGDPNGRGGVRLNLDIKRRADDYRPKNVIQAKFQALCPPGRARIIVWSM